MADVDRNDEADNPRSIERLIFFTDAVVAIAITLLILPVVEIVVDDAVKQVKITTFLAENVPQFIAFALSFAIIARLWIANHSLLLNTVTATRALTWLMIAWVFTIVVLPLPTEISAIYPSSWITVVFYVGTGFTSTVLLAIAGEYLHRRPQLQRPGHPVTGPEVWGIASISGGFVVAIALTLIFPVLSYYSLFVLFLTAPLDAIVKPRIARREAKRLAQDAAAAKQATARRPPSA
jgi:uncharacterized membrane protein